MSSDDGGTWCRDRSPAGRASWAAGIILPFLLLACSASPTGAPNAVEPDPSSGRAKDMSRREPGADPSETKPAAHASLPSVRGRPGPTVGAYVYERTTRMDAEVARSFVDVTVRHVARKGDAEHYETFTQVRGARNGDRQVSGWADDGVRRILSVVVTGESAGDSCTYSPPELMVRFPLRAGTRWKTASSCAGSDEAPQQWTYRVLRSESVQLSAGVVPTFVIERAGSATVSGADYRRVTRSWFSPALGVAVRVVDTADPGLPTSELLLQAWPGS